MTNQSTRVAASMVALAMILSSLACTPGPQNANQNQNQNQNQNGTQANVATTILYNSACDEPDINVRKDEVKKNIDKEIKDDNQLENKVKIDVRKVGETYLEVLIEGQADGKDEINDLSHILKSFMKKKCVLTVYFVAEGTLPLASTARAAGFRWSACEAPMIPCPNGECAIACPALTPDPPRISNTNSKTNSNSTANVNSNTR